MLCGVIKTSKRSETASPSLRTFISKQGSKAQVHHDGTAAVVVGDFSFTLNNYKMALIPNLLYSMAGDTHKCVNSSVAHFY